jgi:hypothetical protein
LSLARDSISTGLGTALPLHEEFESVAEAESELRQASEGSSREQGDERKANMAESNDVQKGDEGTWELQCAFERE